MFCSALFSNTSAYSGKTAAGFSRNTHLPCLNARFAQSKCSESGLTVLTFLIPGLILFAFGAVLVKINNRHIWLLVAAFAVLLLCVIMLALYPGGGS